MLATTAPWWYEASRRSSVFSMQKGAEHVAAIHHGSIR
jgi:hypothetical protein